MSAISGPPIIKSGLILNLDAADRKSYPGSGTTWLDRSGNGNNGILTNGPTFSSANAGTIVFDGVNDYIRTLNDTQVSGSSPRSLSVWFYPTEILASTYYSVCNIGNSTGGGLFEILIRDNDIVGHFYGGGYDLTLSSVKTLLNNFTNCVLTYSGTTIYCYVDGLLKGSKVLVLNTGNTKLDIGIEEYDPHSSFKGRVASTLLYNRELSAQEILQNFNVTKSRFGL